MEQNNNKNKHKNHNKADLRQYKNETISSVVTNIIETPPSDTDPFGSYTGNPKNPDEKPVQDADDL